MHRAASADRLAQLVLALRADNSYGARRGVREVLSDVDVSRLPVWRTLSGAVVEAASDGHVSALREVLPELAAGLPMQLQYSEWPALLASTLHAAVAHQQTCVVRLLTSLGASPFVQQTDGSTAASTAAAAGYRVALMEFASLAPFAGYLRVPQRASQRLADRCRRWSRRWCLVAPVLRASGAPPAAITLLFFKPEDTSKQRHTLLPSAYVHIAAAGAVVTEASGVSRCLLRIGDCTPVSGTIKGDAAHVCKLPAGRQAGQLLSIGGCETYIAELPSAPPGSCRTFNVPTVTLRLAPLDSSAAAAQQLDAFAKAINTCSGRPAAPSPNIAALPPRAGRAAVLLARLLPRAVVGSGDAWGGHKKGHEPRPDATVQPKDNGLQHNLRTCPRCGTPHGRLAPPAS